MMNSIGFFEIQSSNPQREMHFYTTLFGWQFARQEHAPVVFYHITTPTITGGLLERQEPVITGSSGTNAFCCSVQVDDFDAMAQQIMDLGGTVAMPKFAVPGRCWQGYFQDPDKNLFGIFEVDENAK